MRGFRQYLEELPERALPEDLREHDLSGFHYGRYLLERGYDFRSNYAATPLFYDYTAFQQRNIKRYFGELAEYAREYARSVGRKVLISGNFFNLFEHYYTLEPFVDVIATEMRNTLWRYPEWYRHRAGCGSGKALERTCMAVPLGVAPQRVAQDRKSTRLNSSHVASSYAVFCLKKK